MMKDATPRTLEQLHRRNTTYEVAATHVSGRSVVVGFTGRTSRAGLLKVLQSRGDELVDLLGLTDEDEIAFERDDAGRWHARFPRGWAVGFTGFTEREARGMENAGGVR